MLKSLSIENIAVIEKADIDFSEGLNVLTGETGAGKSIVVDSINAILGERTSRELVRHGADYANVTALFQDVNESVISAAEKIGIACENNEIFISRRISAAGKSFCKINGCACTAAMLREIGEKLINIHGQHDSQALLNPDFHYLFLDMLADDKSLYEKYRAAFKRLVSVRKRLKLLTQDADTKDKRLEILNYQIEELTNADIKPNEWQELKNKQELAQNSQALAQALNESLYAINGDEELGGIASSLASVRQSLSSFDNIDGDLVEINSKINSIIDYTDEVKSLIEDKLDGINFSEEELNAIEERLDLLYNFSKKYGETEEDMLNYLQDAVNQRDAINMSDDEIEYLNEEYDRAYDSVISAANALSDYRKGIAKAFEERVKAELNYLDMLNVQFVVEFTQGNLSVNGYDKIEFLISSNPGEPPKPLAKIASGGELSRIMLAIKNIIADKDSVQTLIFDEIDTGVSGRASRKIGLKLKSVSKHTQVICVTHSAQIAACADCHLEIKKSVENGRTYTTVNELDFEQRKYELARIMGGLEITDSLLESAEELLKNGS